MTHAAFSHAQQEADILASLNHAHIVSYVGVFTGTEEAEGVEKPVVTLVMEFCPGGSLLAYIKAVRSECQSAARIAALLRRPF